MIYRLVGANPSDTFCFAYSNVDAIERMLMAIYFDVTRANGKNHFVLSANAETVQHRLDELGCLFERAEMGPHGFVTVENIAETISARTALVSVPAADSETGVIHPDLSSIALLCKERGILFHVDVSAILGEIDFNFQTSGADIITFDGEKIGALERTGGLFLRKNLGLKIAEGSSVSFEEPAQHACESIASTSTHVAILKACFEEKLLELDPTATILFEDEIRLASITAVRFKGIFNEALLYFLERKKISAHPCRFHPHAVSFSFNQHTEQAEIEETLKAIDASCKQLRTYSAAIEVS